MITPIRHNAEGLNTQAVFGASQEKVIYETAVRLAINRRGGPRFLLSSTWDRAVKMMPWTLLDSVRSRHQSCPYLTPLDCCHPRSPWLYRVSVAITVNFPEEAVQINRKTFATSKSFLSYLKFHYEPTFLTCIIKSVILSHYFLLNMVLTNHYGVFCLSFCFPACSYLSARSLLFFQASFSSECDPTDEVQHAAPICTKLCPCSTFTAFYYSSEHFTALCLSLYQF